ncbi:MAG TPA: hypothetical protein VJR87_02455 [Allosphingosinicella sp.]|nr:hypothetical protein [Allosphingosinicella sp.]
MTEPDPRDDEIRARQRSRSVVMAFALLAFAVLMFAITVARMGLKS